MIVADVIAKELKKEGISDIFMLTGYEQCTSMTQ